MYRFFLKRFVDTSIAVMALPLWFLLLIIIGPIIYVQDKGAVFYNAPRLGLNGKQFVMYKFRSMAVNSPDVRNEDGSTFNAEHDPRLTKVGKFLRRTSLDETPQILNIVKGEMSLVGPRPDLPEMLNRYTDFERDKLLVRPGITGYNQAYYRNGNNIKSRLENDVFYTQNLSFMLDTKIIFKTLHTLFTQSNLYRNK